MSKKLTACGRIVGVALSLVLIAGSADAQRRGPRPNRRADRNPYSGFQRFSLSMEGGLGLLERGQGMLDLKVEAQVGITRQFRLGLGFGYMDRGMGHERDMGRDGGRRDMMGGRGQGMMGVLSGLMGSGNTIPGYGGQVEVGRDFRILPLSLNAYYILPLGRRWNTFMSAGGSHCFGSFGGPEGTQDKNAWGGQAGLGFEFRVAPRINLVAQGSYRFVEFTRLKGPRPQSQTPQLDAFLNGLRPLWDARKGEANRPNVDPLFDSLRRTIQQMIAPAPAKPIDLNFNGFSIRAGVKFGI